MPGRRADRWAASDGPIQALAEGTRTITLTLGFGADHFDKGP
jgi:hypothetical protein